MRNETRILNKGSRIQEMIQAFHKEVKEDFFVVDPKVICCTHVL